ncbi:MAG: MFS transporter [Clostridia bacterium]|nr:MFS transporter [Clostridia bacterium]MBQ9774224.1 MFS transporter [Clostridia bacterium]
MKLSQKAKNAILIGSLCSISYFAVYIARNLLSAVTPQMLEAGYSDAYIGSVSALYFVFYAIGQLINGIIGDHIHAKWMICVGLLGAGITNFIFSRITAYPESAMIVYALTGFFLSMIYGPMTKVVSENTEPIHATRCSLGYTFASFFGSPSAGILASLLAWQNVFAVGSTILATMSVLGFFFFTHFEKRGIVQYGQYKPQKKGAGNIGVLIQHGIIRFSLISIITGVIRTSVVFWLPTYINQYLGFSSRISAILFTATTLIISLTAFIAVFVYERLGHNMNKTILLMFSLSACFFLATYLVKTPVLNIIFIVLAIMASNSSASMLWSRYCPSLRDTGMVSFATGFLDFLSYMAAAAANLIFANAVSAIGWKRLIIVWFSLMVFGVLISLPYQKMQKLFHKKRTDS